MKLIFAVLLISTSFASEGLFSQLELKNRPGYRDSYVELEGCGAIRIHPTKNYVLTALHCVTHGLDSIPPHESIELGNPFAFDFISRYKSLNARKLKDGSVVIASGKCFTGLDIEVLDEESRSNRKLAYECALGDWAIIEMPKLKATQCSPVVEDETGKFYSLGATKKEITRSVGLQKLNGFVFTHSQVFKAADLVKDSRYAFSSLWTKALTDYEALLTNKFLLTDGDVMNGMSGGPILNSNFALLAVTTTALLPTNIWKFEGAFSFENGYNFGIHGGIKVSHILNELRSEGMNPRDYFDCL